MGHRKVIETTVEHFQRHLLKGHPHFIRHRIGEVDQHRIKQPGGPNLQLDAVERTGPEGSVLADISQVLSNN